MQTDSTRPRLTSRIQAWWQRTPPKDPVGASRTARDDYWHRRLNALHAQTRVPLRPADAGGPVPAFVAPRAYDAAQHLVEAWTAASPSTPCLAPDAPTAQLAQVVTGTLAALRRARADLLRAAIAKRPYTGAIELALCVVLVGARRLPAFFAAQVACDMQAALVEESTQDEAQRRSAQAFAMHMEHHSTDAERVACVDDKLDALLLRHVHHSTRSAVAWLVFAGVQARQWQGAMQSGRDVCDTRAMSVAAGYTCTLWQERWAMQSASVYMGDALCKTLT